MSLPDTCARSPQPTVPPDLAARFGELREYLRWSPADATAIAPLRACLAPHTSEFINDFYAELTRHAAAARVMTGGPAQIARLKQSLAHWLSDLLSGVYDEAYVARRWTVGFRHVQIGLDQTYVGAALARLRSCMSRRLAHCCAQDPATYPPLAETLHKLLDLDQNLIQAAYEAEYQSARQTEQEHRLHHLVERLPAAAIYVQGETLHLNAAAEEVTGYRRAELTTASRWQEITSLDESLAVALPGGEDGPRRQGARSRSSLRRRDGVERTLELLHFQGDHDEVWLLQDITEADLARLKALQAERLALIGQMITTLAHEARNALQRIRASTETLELELEDRADLSPVLARLSVAQDDLKTLFDEVRNYAAPVTLDREETRLCELALSAWDSLIEPRKGRLAKLSCQVPPQDTLGWYDRFRIEQVFRNLFENSLAACPDPVEIRLSARATQWEGRPAVEVTVADNGPGLPESVRDRVFEPFFTTKTKGTGLGMAIADRIVAAHGGRIEVGAPASGAEFRIVLPRVDYDARPADHCGG
jgi:PAS domain S-box-containing protein